MVTDRAPMSLPYDLNDRIASMLASERDLLHLALTNKEWKDVIIPQHLEYQSIRMSQNQPRVWRHLAEKTHLASRIRRVSLYSWFNAETNDGRDEQLEGGNKAPADSGSLPVDDGTRRAEAFIPLPAGVPPDIYPRTWVDTELPPNPPSLLDFQGRYIGTREKDVGKAFSNMHSLQSFYWGCPTDSNKYKSHIAEEWDFSLMTQVFQGLIVANSIRRLYLRDVFATIFGPQKEELKKPTYPLWNIRGLESLVLDIYCPPGKDGTDEYDSDQDSSDEELSAPMLLANLTKINLDTLTTLQLNLNYTPRIILKWTFPNLRKLSLATRAVTTAHYVNIYAHYTRQFLYNNPTIQHLDTSAAIHLPISRPLPADSKFLPNLQAVRLRWAARKTFQRILQSSRVSPRPLSSIAGLSLRWGTLNIMLRQETGLESLQYLSFYNVNGPDDYIPLGKLGKVAPNLKVLQYWNESDSSEVDDNDLDKPKILDFDTFLSIVAGFPVLRAIGGIVVQTTTEQMGSILGKISDAAPLLEAAGLIVVDTEPDGAATTKYFKVNPKDKVWEQKGYMHALFLHEEWENVGQYSPVGCWINFQPSEL
ncbi:hypothetical protein BKA70DRAFT_1266912 [Coprinopsis sp. MPI-PUGE-AT-0042]|nr:hypothetical protein BKA70DRAFT_1266912 [Coprinopsis sp. MPI-PUGE-AT-0042]